jgi:tetratricopeptide (TPR) repeat protein/O-antigen ligase
MDTSPKIEVGSSLEKASFIVLLLTLLLTPLVFIPSSFIPLDVSKTAVITIGIIASTILYLVSILKSKQVYVSKHPVIIISSLLVLSTAISTVLSTNFVKSLSGQGFESGTASFIILLFISYLLTMYLTYKDRSRLVYIYGAVIITFTVVAIFQILRLIMGVDFMSLGIFNTSTSTLLGKWSDLGMLSAVVVIVLYLAVRFLDIGKKYLFFTSILLLVSMFFVVLINSLVVWGLLAVIFSLIVLYEFRVNTATTSFFRKIPILTSIVAIIFILGLWKGDLVSNVLVKKLNVAPTEVVLPWQLTLDVTSDTIKERPLFGVGPNRFVNQYLKYKPLEVNQTIFWDTIFTSGFGLIPSFTVTQGLVGLVLWLIFIGVFTHTGYVHLKRNTNPQSAFLITSTFFTSLFLWLACLVYVPSHSMLVLTFVLSGLFMGTLVNTGAIEFKTIDSGFCKKLYPYFSIAMLVVLALWLVIYTKKIIAIGYFQSGVKAISLPNKDGVDKAANDFNKAVYFDESDTYYQALSEINIKKAGILVQEMQGSNERDETKIAEMSNKIGATVDEAVIYTRKAIDMDPTNFYNHLSEARISEFAATLKINNAYENAKQAYSNALQFNPYSPSIYLNLARLEVTQNNFAEAQRNIGMAIQLKPNYVEAIFLMSQVQVSLGQIADAITSVKYAIQITPNNPLLHFQLGLLQYNNKNYSAAIESLSAALKLDDKYANAQYFLGLSYARLNKIADAIIQFENLSANNPDNEEVALILSNLRKGKLPFADAKAPIDSKPESRKTLPVKEKVTRN